MGMAKRMHDGDGKGIPKTTRMGPRTGGRMILSLSSIPTDLRLPILEWARNVAIKHRLTLEIKPADEALMFLDDTKVSAATAIRAEFDIVWYTLTNVRAWL